MGCYVDYIPRDLDGPSITDINFLTIEVCIGYCKAKSYSYAGAQTGWENCWVTFNIIKVESIYLNFSKSRSQCYCGNSYGRYGSSPSCTFPCAGNANQLCGNGWVNSVYSTSYISNLNNLLNG